MRTAVSRIGVICLTAGLLVGCETMGEWADATGETVGGWADATGDTVGGWYDSAAGSMTGSGFDPNQRRIVAALSMLESGSELEAVPGHYSVVMIGGGHQRRRVAGVLPDVVDR